MTHMKYLIVFKDILYIEGFICTSRYSCLVYAFISVCCQFRLEVLVFIVIVIVIIIIIIIIIGVCCNFRLQV